MTTVQERLQLKRVPLDKWSIREQLCLASAVACSGDQNWMSVSRTLKMMCGTNRPSDWFSQKSCAAQYGKLLENVETPKRKKRTDKEGSTWNTVETPSESILRKLTQERIAELNRFIQEEQREYSKLKEEIFVAENTTDDAKLREVWQQIDIEQKQRKKEEAQHAQWLKEREDRKLELERAWRPATHLYHTSSPSLSPAPSPLTVNKSISEDMDIEEIKPGTSPLLTSLLKLPANSGTTVNTSSGATTSMSVSSSRVAPTITNLLTGTSKPNTSTSLAPAFPKLMLNTSLTGPPPYEYSGAAQVAPTQSPSQAAPTLSMLLENKSKEHETSKPQTISDPVAAAPPNPTPVKQSNFAPSNASPEAAGDKSSVGSPNKDEEQQLMEVFNTLIPDNIDDLADILTDSNAIILNSDLLAEAEESILESVESLMAEQMDSEDFEQSLSNQAMTEPISTAELVEQLTSPSGFPMGPTSTVKGDASPKATNDNVQQLQPQQQQQQQHPETITIRDSLDVDPESTTESEAPQKISKDIIDVNSKDDEQSSDLSNDAPLSELFKHDKSSSNAETKQQTTESVETVAIQEDAEDEDDDDEDVEAEVDSPKERTDVFESDSNDDKCLEIIKREIHELSGLKENESSDNSNEAPPKPLEKLSTNNEEEEEEKQPLASPKATSSTTTTKAKEIDATNDENKMEIEPIVEPVDEQHQPQPNTTTTTTPILLIESNATTSDTPEDNSEVEILRSSSPKKRINRIVSTNSSEDLPFEDAKEELPKDDQQQQPAKPEVSITIEDTDDESSSVVSHDDKPTRSKRDYTRRKIDSSSSAAAAAEKQRSIDETPHNIILPDDKPIPINTRVRAKDHRDRSESPYIDDNTDAESTHSKSKRRYSSTPVLDSMPASPASSIEDNREYRAWKRSINLVLNKLSQHKYSSLFHKPIPTDQNPSYKDIILRPMDMQTLRRNVDAGVVRLTVEFQRDIMLMCSNAVMYNSEDETVVRQFKADALQSIDTIMEPWRKEYDKAVSSAAGGGGSGAAAVTGPAAPSPVPVTSVAASASSTVTSTSAAPKPMVRGRKSHRFSGGQQSN